jgi:hypothetical protein
LRASEGRGAIADKREMSSTRNSVIFILLPAAKVDHPSDIIAQKRS